MRNRLFMVVVMAILLISAGAIFTTIRDVYSDAYVVGRAIEPDTIDANDIADTITLDAALTIDGYGVSIGAGGTPTVTLGDEDLYVKGTFEVDSGADFKTYLDIVEATITANPIANTGRLYSADASGTTTLYYLDNAGTLTNLLSAGAGNTLDQSYDQGGAGSGKAITADSGAVAISNTDADAAWLLTLNASPGSSAALGGLQITNGANSTQDALEFANSGTGKDIYGTSGTWDVTKAGAATFASLSTSAFYQAAIASAASGNTNLTIDAAGTGTITVAGTSTGNTIFTRQVNQNGDVNIGDTSTDTLTITSIIDGDVTLDDGSGASPSLILKDATDETATFSKVDAGVLSLTTVAGDGFNLLTGNVWIGNGTPGTAAMNGEDFYCEGESEFDGAMQVDGAATFAGTLSGSGTIALTGTTQGIGTSNSVTTLNVGTGTGGNTFNIGTDNSTKDTINIGSALDDTIINGAGTGSLINFASFDVATSGNVTTLGTLTVNTATANPLAVTSTLATASTACKIYNSNDDVTAQQYLLALDYDDDGDADADYLICRDNQGADTKFSVLQDGDTTIAGTTSFTGTTQGLGTSASATTINMATGAGGNTVNVGTDNTLKDTINIGSALDDTIINGAGTGSLIDFANFDVATTGNTTVAVSTGLDTNAAGELRLGYTTATTVSAGTTAATTLNFGAGGALTRAINIGTGTGADTINIGTGGTGADVITIGGGVGTLAINSGDWDISTIGDMTGIGNITTDGTFNLNGDLQINDGANKPNGTAVFDNATDRVTITNTLIDAGSRILITVNANAVGTVGRIYCNDPGAGSVVLGSSGNETADFNVWYLIVND